MGIAGGLVGLLALVALAVFFPLAFRKIGASFSSSVGGADDNAELSESLMVFCVVQIVDE